MKKLVFSVDVNDAKSKKEVMKAVSGFLGIESLSIDLEKKKLTVIGDVDPIEVLCKLRKRFHANIETVGPNKDEGDKKKNEGKDDKSNQQEIQQIIRAHYNAYYPNYTQPDPYPYPYPYPYYIPVEDNPSSCVIC